MFYTDEQQRELEQEYASAYADMRDMTLTCLRAAEATEDAVSKEHLCHGAARRIGLLARTMQRIFELFPLGIDRPLPMESLHDVQINLHAFVMNVYGVFENFAWAFVLRHDLLPSIGTPANVSLFKDATRRRVPQAVADYLSSDSMTRWHTDYLKNYRDALAHRIPLYIPPRVLTKEESERLNALEIEKQKLAVLGDWDRVNTIWTDQEIIGSPCFTFLHSLEHGNASRVVLLHPQVISDSKTVIEFGRLFLRSWHEVR